jgi:hypothetical protein
MKTYGDGTGRRKNWRGGMSANWTPSNKSIEHIPFLAP